MPKHVATVERMEKTRLDASRQQTAGNRGRHDRQDAVGQRQRACDGVTLHGVQSDRRIVQMAQR
jgi:hypothetical protein